MLQKGLDELTVDDLKLLVARRVPENRRLEFKRDRYRGDNRAKKEAAADISAMANGVGGTLIVGIAEENGCASELVGVEIADPDGFVRSIQDSIKSSIEPALHGEQIKWVPIDDQRGAVVINIPRSWYGPHRVIVNNDQNFYIRDENGKHPMSVEELRRAFVAGSAVSTEIRNFREERISLLERDEGPLEVRFRKPKLVVHMVPNIAFVEPVSFNIQSVRIQPFDLGILECFPSVEGKVFYNEKAFSTLFRDGRLEAVRKIDVGHNPLTGQRNFFSIRAAERDIIQTFLSATRIFDGIGVAPPYAVMVSFLDIKGYLGWEKDYSLKYTYPCRRDRLLLPPLEVTDAELESETADTLFPLATLLWNAFGFEASPNFNQEGRYITGL